MARYELLHLEGASLLTGDHSETLYGVKRWHDTLDEARAACQQAEANAPLEARLHGPPHISIYDTTKEEIIYD